MRCPICNSEDDGISIDPRTRKFGDCYVCSEVVTETVQSYPTTEEEDVLDVDG